MHLTRLEVTDFQGIKRIVLEPEPFTLVCGHNWSGKTSLQQAVRLVLTGDVARVDLKGDYKLLIREGAKAARVRAVWDGEDWNAEIKPSANLIPTAEAMPPALLDQHRLSRMPVDDRRRELLRILGTKSTEDVVVQKLVTAGVPGPMIDDVMAVFPAGFEAMAKLADGWATEARGAWRQVTGEAYGDSKAETWQAAMEQLTKDEKAALITVDKRAELVKLAEEQLAEFEPLVTGMREELRRSGVQFTCPHCGALSDMVSAERANEIRVALPDHEKSLSVLHTALQNRKRDLQRAYEAQAKYDQLEKAAKERTERAAAAHKNAKAWKNLKELLSPGGIPSELLQEALEPVNERLRATGSAYIGYATIGQDCQIRKDGRLYGLLSESEQWMTDAMLVEALCYVTGRKFLMLDRLDVLDLPNRNTVVAWMRRLVLQHEYQVLLFATLKKKPALGEGALSVWLDSGEEKIEEVAA